ncbi:hypothetical protein DS745_19190 [Anaerobacillus alkaliphilus]|uniref:Uncharacterized protein n=1 Tax=Anaerobacillus alkaliphilus TaxID=1548597 RepID=A0A4Q0VPP1_9BACI|nr:tetratricopeptide repeat protein [Anaerobacillus alkaliphilus]RXI98452.1 hypothetical protein DS745_19190 [Anaerobacillus alkaliphilus]
MSEEQKKRQDKVVLFPGVVDKLVGKGMDSLKEKRFSQAHSYFEQALNIEPDHPQGRFGVALSLIEQSRLEEAKDVTENMLKEDIGNYYDILQVHISLLVQLGHYAEVVTMLEGIMEEEKLPANLAESFYHLLHFSRQMVDDGTPIEIADDIQFASEELILMLNEGSPEKQWIAIQMLGKKSNHIFFESVKDFLKDGKQDPILKSLILQLLKEKKVEENIEIHKFGKVLDINISEIDHELNEEFRNETLTIVARHLENDNPSLFDVVRQLWSHYLLALYPFSPEPFTPSIWAAALHKTGAEMTGIEEDERHLANQYGVKVAEVQQCSLKINIIEQETFKGV